MIVYFSITRNMSRDPINGSSEHSMNFGRSTAGYIMQIAAWVILTASSGFAQRTTISSDLQDLPPRTGSVDVIVQYKNSPTNRDEALAKALGATNGKALPVIRSAKYHIKPSAIASLVRENANVKY